MGWLFFFFLDPHRFMWILVKAYSVLQVSDKVSECIHNRQTF